LADGVEPATAARLLASVVAGLRVMGKTVPDRATTQATVDALLGQFTK
jgi:TetR/AcrR family transcriptional regulator, transcriptional repressor for nem operon